MNFYAELDDTERARASMYALDVEVDYFDDEDYEVEEDHEETCIACSFGFI